MINLYNKDKENDFKVKLALGIAIVGLVIISAIFGAFVMSRSMSTDNPTQNQTVIVAEGSVVNVPLTNLNTASSTELKLLPTVGEKKANLIINNRPYYNIADIIDIDGIGIDCYEAIKERVTVN